MSETVKQIEVKKLLICGELMFAPGEKVDALKVNDDAYKVFLCNGWWAVPPEYFE